MRRFTLASALLALLALVAIGSAGGAPAPNTTLDVIRTIPSAGVTTATFSTTGLLCPAGTVELTGISKGQAIETFTCADASGTFSLGIRKSNRQQPDVESWTAVSGTGSYGAIQGKGKRSTTIVGSGDPEVIHYVYSGTIKLS